MSRIPARFARLKAEGRAGLVTFITAGDPDPATSQALLDGLPAAGADLIELGMPFSDPMADGPAIQAASQRALAAGANMGSTLAMVAKFRRTDQATPIVLMGYYNPIYAHGVAAFCEEAAKAGVDGLIVVDLPPEEAEELAGPARAQGMDFIFLTAPTTDDARLPVVLASGYSAGAEDAIREGFAFLQKPYGMARLCEVLAAKLGKPAAQHEDAG